MQRLLIIWRGSAVGNGDNLTQTNRSQRENDAAEKRCALLPAVRRGIELVLRVKKLRRDGIRAAALARRHLRPNPGGDVLAGSLNIVRMCQLAQVKSRRLLLLVAGT